MNPVFRKHPSVRNCPYCGHPLLPSFYLEHVSDCERATQRKLDRDHEKKLEAVRKLRELEVDDGK